MTKPKFSVFLSNDIPSKTSELYESLYDFLSSIKQIFPISMTSLKCNGLTFFVQT